jgi:hypothetical protein
MVLALLVSVSIIAALLARLLPRWDATFAWLVGAVLAGCASIYTEGFDREEYVLIIESTRQLADQDLALRLFAAKDPLFFFIIEVAGALTEDSQLVFWIVSVLAAMTKVIATSVIPGRRTTFMALYAIFIAPGLEFAAIRAGLAIGLTMLGYLAIRRWPWKVWWVALGIASHMSVIFVTAGRIWAHHWSATLIALAILVPVMVPLLLPIVQDDARYFHYLDNRGTPLAFGLPGATLLCLLILSRSLKGERRPLQHPVLTDDWLRTTYFVVGISIVLTIPIVTAATRVMELGWVLLLMQMIARDGQVQRRAQALRIGSWCTLVALLSLANLVRGTWAILV